MSAISLFLGVAGLWALASALAQPFRLPTARERVAASLLLFCVLPGMLDAFLATLHPGRISRTTLFLATWGVAVIAWMSIGLARISKRRTAAPGGASSGNSDDGSPDPLTPQEGTRPSAGSRRGDRAGARRSPRAAWAAVAVVLFCILLMEGHLPPRFADSILYHLLHPVQWSQTGEVTFRLLADPRIDPWARAEGTPKAVESLAHVLMVFSGSIHAATLTQFPWLLLGVVSLAGLGGRLGLSSASQGLAALLFLLTPEILLQSTDLYSDVAMTSAALSALLFGLGLRTASDHAIPRCPSASGMPPVSRVTPGGAEPKEPGPFRVGQVLRSRWFFFGVATGALAATKPTGPLVAMALVVGLAAWIAVENRLAARRTRADLRTDASPVRPATIGGYPPHARSILVAGAVGMILVAGPWFLRILLDFGNPIYPYALRVAGHEILPGPQDARNNSAWLARRGLTPLQAWWRAWTDSDPGSGIASRFSGLGPVPIILGLPAIAAILLGCLRIRQGPLEHAAKPEQDTREWLLLVGCAVVVLFATPDRWWPRFALILPALASLSLAGLLAGKPFCIPARPALGILLAAACAWNILRVIPALPGIMLAPETWMLEIAADRPSSLMVERRSVSYTCMDFVREELSRRPGRLLVIGGGVPGALYPPDFGPLTLDAFSPEGLDGPRWVEALRQRGVTHLLFTWLYPGRPPEYAWVLERPTQFTRVLASLTGGAITPYDRERITWQELWAFNSTPPSAP